MSDPVNAGPLPRHGDHQAECRLRPALAGLITQALSRSGSGFESFVERAGQAQVTGLLTEVLRGPLDCDPRASTERTPHLTSCGNDSQLPTQDANGPGPETESRTRAGQEQARRALYAALTDPHEDADPTALDELAERANWPLPKTVRAIALRSATDIRPVAAALGDCLIGPPGYPACLLVPAPVADDRARIGGVLRGRAATVGHAVPLHDAHASLRWACRLWDMTASCAAPATTTVTGAGAGPGAGPGTGPGAGPAPGPLFVEDQLSLLVLLQDESLARVLVAHRLRPLAGLTPERCARLEATLLAWLGGGGAPEVAKALSIHPQTVRYRMRQIEKLFGARLRDPRTRFEIEMALRSRQLMDRVRRARTTAGGRARGTTRRPWKPPLPTARQAGLNGL